MVNVPDIAAISRLIKEFESKKRPHQGGEVWSGRDLMQLFHYGSWQKFRNAIYRASDAIRASGLPPETNLIQSDEVVERPNGSMVRREDYFMTRHGAYMLMQELRIEDSSLAAFAKTYFSGQTQVAEIIQKEIAELDERLKSRSELRKAEKNLNAVLWERGVTGPGIGIIRNEGDKALFGKATRLMKHQVGGKETKPLANKLHTINIKAKELTAAMTTHNAEEKNLKGHFALEDEHVENNLTIRDALGKRGIIPEQLPAGEDTEILEKRLAGAQPMATRKGKPELGMPRAPHPPIRSRRLTAESR